MTADTPACTTPPHIRPHPALRQTGSFVIRFLLYLPSDRGSVPPLLLPWPLNLPLPGFRAESSSEENGSPGSLLSPEHPEQPSPEHRGEPQSQHLGSRRASLGFQAEKARWSGHTQPRPVDPSPRAHPRILGRKPDPIKRWPPPTHSHTFLCPPSYQRPSCSRIIYLKMQMTGLLPQAGSSI